MNKINRLIDSASTLPKKIALFFCFFATISAYSWNFVGHEVVAEIAYEHLTPKAKQTVNQLDKVMQINAPRLNQFYKAATWPDLIRLQGVSAFDHWHYINIPLHAPNDKVESILSGSDNVVWAINQSESVLSNKNSTPFQKGMFLWFLAHFVGDIHQPLHTTEQVSAEYPDGDQGGNLVLIHSKNAKNLHQLWDNGLGLLNSKKKRLELARKIQKEFPEKILEPTVSNLDPKQWARESHEIAENFVYKLPPDSSISRAYEQQGQTIAKKRIALAGYRLAKILNQLYS